MISTDIRRFDLYDIFSVLVPGMALVLGLSPFLPTFIDFRAVEMLIPLLLLGFVAGRAAHSFAISIERFSGRTSHRDRFCQELKQPNLLTEKTVSQFCQECVETFETIDTNDLSDNLIDSREVAETIYVLTRSYIHMDSRGRSRVFQAVYSFHRSMWFISGFVAMAYFSYGFLSAIGALNEIVPFKSYLGSFDIPTTLVMTGGEMILLLGYYAFSKARYEYQGYFVQYLIGDFLVLTNADYPEAVIVAESMESGTEADVVPAETQS